MCWGEFAVYLVETGHKLLLSLGDGVLTQEERGDGNFVLGAFSTESFRLVFGGAHEKGAAGDENPVDAQVTLYELGRLSSGQAAELAGMSRVEFLLSLERYQVCPLSAELADLEQSVA
jgi:predicted HTH domain antitoxin